MVNVLTLQVGAFGVNCYIVYKTGEAVVIDPGEDYERIVQLALEKGLTIKAVLLTHGHFDHIGAVEKLRLAGAKVYISREDSEMLNDGNKNVAYICGFDFSPTRADCFYDDTLDICSIHFEVLKTPGHTPGGVCLLTENLLFSGDTLFCQSIGRSDFPGGNMAVLKESIKNKLFALPDDTVVYPGHNQPTTIGDEKKYNPFLIW